MPPIFATIDNYPYAGTPIRVDFVDDLPHSFMQSPDRTLAEELASDVAMSYNWVLDGHEHIVRVRVMYVFFFTYLSCLSSCFLSVTNSKAPHGLDRHTTVRAYGVLQQWVGTFHIPCNEGEVWVSNQLSYSLKYDLPLSF